MSPQHMQQCIQECTSCHQTCLAAIQQCLQKGGRHAGHTHIRLLADCAQICTVSADFMLRGSDMHPRTCGVCALVCARCAEDCQRLSADDEQMRRCADVCRKCAESCRRMAEQAA
jgi:hypothetical protein